MIAHQWSVNEETDTVSGTVKWTNDTTMRRGRDALARIVAIAHPDRLAPTHREFSDSAGTVCPSPLRHGTDDTPNTGFVRYPEGYDPRG